MQQKKINNSAPNHPQSKTVTNSITVYTLYIIYIMLRSGLVHRTGEHHTHNVFSNIGHESIGTIAKLGVKEDIYSNIFNQIDRDQNGYLDKGEFRDATKALNLSLPETELTQIYNTISDRNGVITLESFTKFIQKSVRIHKQFMQLQQEFRSSILNKLALAASSSTSIHRKWRYHQHKF